MFRGAIILGIGFSLGYVKGLRDSKEVAEMMADIVEALKEATKTSDTSDTSDTSEPTEASAEEVLGTATPIQSEPTTEGE